MLIGAFTYLPKWSERERERERVCVKTIKSYWLRERERERQSKTRTPAGELDSLMQQYLCSLTQQQPMDPAFIIIVSRSRLSF